VSCLTNVFATLNAVNGDFAPARSTTVVASLAVGAEAALLGLAAILYAVLWAVGEGESRSLSLGLAGVCAAAAATLGFLARAMWHARRWAVSPLITWQVLQGFAGAYAISVGEVAIGVVALGLGVVAAAALALAVRSAPSPG
jgi:hypothetical protein